MPISRITLIKVWVHNYDLTFACTLNVGLFVGIRLYLTEMSFNSTGIKF